MKGVPKAHLEKLNDLGHLQETDAKGRVLLSYIDGPDSDFSFTFAITNLRSDDNGTYVCVVVDQYTGERRRGQPYKIQVSDKESVPRTTTLACVLFYVLLALIVVCVLIFFLAIKCGWNPTSRVSALVFLIQGRLVSDNPAATQAQETKELLGVPTPVSGESFSVCGTY